MSTVETLEHLNAAEEQRKETLQRVKALGTEKKDLVTDEGFHSIHAEVVGS